MTMPDQERIDRVRIAFAKNPRQMTLHLARNLGIPEVDVIRALPDGLSIELQLGKTEELIRSFEPLGKVHVIVTNGGVTLESFGQFGNFSAFGEYFNVQTSSLDMHIRFRALSVAFAVRKPGHMDGVDTLSVQFFDEAGAAAFKVFLTFGSKAPSPERQAHFDQIIAKFRA